MKLESYYSRIAQMISEMIVEEWTEVKVFVEDDGLKFFFFYYLSEETKEWISGSDIVERFDMNEEYHEQFEDELSFCISDFKKEYETEFGDAWTCFQMSFLPDGRFEVSYYYEKKPFGPIVTGIAWEYEHLGIKQENDPFYQKLLKEYLDSKAQGKSYPFLSPIKLR
ncbi:immunity protein YezG family protein [Rossellomorea marisflavi]|uniref:immunity protein YezG family protein n=1 Tax=Rossellomorea marisflavi TaxID=189381 RepID=UPI00345B226F